MTVTETNPPRAKQRAKTGGALLGLTAVAVLAVTACGRNPTVLVDSDPTGATVWMGADPLGTTPLRLRLPRNGKLHLRISRPSFMDGDIVIDAAHLPPNRRVRVELHPEQTLTLTCKSHPPNAEVFVDGEYRGKTPLALKDLQPGIVELVFKAKDRAQVRRTLELEGSDGDQVVEVTLPSLTEAYYRQMIKENPKAIEYYVDLAHHYVLEHNFNAAAEVLDRAIRLTLKDQNLSVGRLWDELHRVIVRQYNYGGPAEVRQANTVLRKALAKLVKDYPRDNVQVHINYVAVLHALGETDKAAEAFADAWELFPGDKQLRRLRKQRGYSVR